MSNYRNTDNERFADIFKALSNPHRLKIFMSLANCAVSAQGADNTGDEDQICTCVGEIGQNLNIAPSTISHHLKELHGVGLINMKRRGQAIDCWVDPRTIDAIIGFINIKEQVPV